MWLSIAENDKTNGMDTSNVEEMNLLLWLQCPFEPEGGKTNSCAIPLFVFYSTNEVSLKEFFGYLFIFPHLVSFIELS